MEYFTKYPKTVEILGSKKRIRVDKEGVEQLHLVVKKSFDDLMKIFDREGFTKVRLEHKQPFQVGKGLNLKLKKPWEMHVRLVRMKEGLIAIHAEVEVSRDYLQHLFSQRTPVIYEVQSMLAKYNIESKIWSSRVKDYVTAVFDHYRIKLATPKIPVFAWKPMPLFIGAVGLIYLWKYINTI